MEDFELDIIIDRQAAKIKDCDPCKISALAREKIRADVKGMISKNFGFQIKDELEEFSQAIQAWTERHPSQ